MRLVIDRCLREPQKASLYVRETVAHGWSRAVLMNQIDSQLYERHGRAVSNFSQTLPEPQSACAQELTRDPYQFDFLAIRESYGERELTSKHRVSDAKVTVSGHDDASVPPPLAIGIAELFQRLMPFGNTELYGGMVETEGLLRDINRRQTTTQLLVGEGDSNLQVEIPWALEDALPADLVQGATVKVRGILTYTSIENYEEGIFGRIENIELIPMSPSAVEVVRRAPFFTAERLLFVLAWVLALREAHERQIVGHFHGKILAAVHRVVALARAQCCVELLHEQAFAADLIETPIENLVARRLERGKVDLASRMRFTQKVDDHLRLHYGKLAVAAADDDLHPTLLFK